MTWSTKTGKCPIKGLFFYNYQITGILPFWGLFITSCRDMIIPSFSQPFPLISGPYCTAGVINPKNTDPFMPTVEFIHVSFNNPFKPLYINHINSLYAIIRKNMSVHVHMATVVGVEVRIVLVVWCWLPIDFNVCVEFLTGLVVCVDFEVW